MPDWPSIDRVDDRRMAQSLRDGDPDALVQILDGYATRLYDYCHALLRDRDFAAHALHDAFIAAHAHIARLREPERFRSWLYALVRNECLRRLNDPERPGERYEAPEVEDPFLDAEERARRQETRQLVHSALSGLSGRQREAVDLILRHDLDTQELAGVLGISPQQAAEMAGQARSQLDDALAAAVIARTGRGECPSVAALVDTWEWPLTPTVCRRLVRHIETCPTCSERRKRKVSTARLLQVMPVALMPPDLQVRVLTCATAPDLAGERALIAERAESFDAWGWPSPVDLGPRRTAPRRATSRRAAFRTRQGAARLWPIAAAAACVAIVIITVFVGLPRSSRESARGSSSPGVAAPEVSEPVIASPADSSDSPEPLPSTPTPTSTATTQSPTTEPTLTRSKSPSPIPTKKSPTPKPTPKNGTLSVNSCGDIGAELSCTMTVTAVGGPVTWSVTGTTNGVMASGSGTLGAGKSDSVTVTRPACGTGSDAGGVTFSPNGIGTVSWTCAGT